MSPYIQQYQNTYNEQLLLCQKFIKQELIYHANEFHDKYFATNDVLRKFIEAKNNLLLHNKKYENLIHKFNNRTDIYSCKHQYLIIPKKIQPRFLEINDSLEDFKQFVTELATIDAFTETSRLFQNNSGIYRRIYELNRFDLIETDTYSPLKDDSLLNEKLYDGTLKEMSLSENVYISNLEDKKEVVGLNYTENLNEVNLKETPVYNERVNFKININHKSNFRNSYFFFTDFFDEEEISQDCFESVFFKDSNSHNYVITFNCETNIAAYLLTKMNKSIFKNLSQVNIEKSKKFKSKDGVFFTQSTLSRSKNRVDLDSQEKIDSFILDLTRQAF